MRLNRRNLRHTQALIKILRWPPLACNCLPTWARNWLKFHGSNLLATYQPVKFEGGRWFCVNCDGGKGTCLILFTFKLQGHIVLFVFLCEKWDLMSFMSVWDLKIYIRSSLTHNSPMGVLCHYLKCIYCIYIKKLWRVFIVGSHLSYRWYLLFYFFSYLFLRKLLLFII